MGILGLSRPLCGKFGSYRFSHYQAAGAPNQRNAGGIDTWAVLSMYGGAVCGRDAFRIDDVFDTDRHTMDQPIRWIIVEFLGGGYGRVWVEIFPGADIGFTIFDAFEKGACDGLTCCLADFDGSGGFQRGKFRQIHGRVSFFLGIRLTRISYQITIGSRRLKIIYSIG